MSQQRVLDSQQLIVYLLVLSVIAIGCGDIPLQERVEDVELGMSKSDVRDIRGEPEQIGMRDDSENQSTWLYIDLDWTDWKGQSSPLEVYIIFENGVVVRKDDDSLREEGFFRE